MSTPPCTLTPPWPEATGVALPLSRSGLVRASLAVHIAFLITVLGVVAAVAPTDITVWGGTLFGLAMMYAPMSFCLWEISTWIRRVPPVIVDANAIELQRTGPVPWDAIREVVIGRRQIRLELLGGDGPRRHADWWTRDHEGLMGDGDVGHIHVPLRWVDAAPHAIAALIRRVTAVPVRVE